MELITIIFSGLALLAASVCLVLLVQEKKRNQKRNAALCDLLRREFEPVNAYVGESNVSNAKEHAEIVECLKYISQILRVVVNETHEMNQTSGDIEERVEKLEKGIVPDYNEAVEAKAAVDNFSRDIAALLNFDPLEAAREARNSRRRGGEVSE